MLAVRPVPRDVVGELFASDQMLRYGLLVTSGTAGGRKSLVAALPGSAPQAKVESKHGKTRPAISRKVANGILKLCFIDVS